MPVRCRWRPHRRRRRDPRIVGRRPWYCDGIQQSLTGISDLEVRQDGGPVRVLVGHGSSAGVAGVMVATDLALEFHFFFILQLRISFCGIDSKDCDTHTVRSIPFRQARFAPISVVSLNHHIPSQGIQTGDSERG